MVERLLASQVRVGAMQSMTPIKLSLFSPPPFFLFLNCPPKAALEIEVKRLQMTAAAAQDTAREAVEARQSKDNHHQGLEREIQRLEAALAEEKTLHTKSRIKVGRAQ